MVAQIPGDEGAAGVLPWLSRLDLRLKRSAARCNNRHGLPLKNITMAWSDDILRALDAFIRKYYKNQLIRGVLYTTGILLTLFLAVVLVEHFGWLPKVARGIMFWVVVVSVVVVVGWLVVRPLVKMYGHRHRLGRAEAARIVGRHFPEVGDKLLNLLQLMEADEGAQGAESDLLLAAVEQKTAQLRPVPFLKAIDLRKNRRYLRYALPPLVVLLLLLLVSPQVVTAPSRRIVNYTSDFERPAPFRFVVLNERLEAQQGADFELRVTTEGEAQPAEVTLDVEGRRYRMHPDHGTFSYTFNRLQRSQTFRFEGGGVTSDECRLEVLPNPRVLSFRMVLSYPAYTGREAETVVGLGDAAVPEGTVVRWLFQTRDADTLHLGAAGGEWMTASAVDERGQVGVSRRVMTSCDYAFCVSGAYSSSDTLHYSLSAIADAVPQIAVDELVDSLYPDRKIFRGRIKDDYGFSRLIFVHQTTNRADTAGNALSEAEIALGDGISQEFFFSFNLAELVLSPGDEVSYWFEVSDNDAIHGPKTVRSQRFEVKIPTEDELDSLLRQSASDVRQSADMQMGELQRLQEEIGEMMKKLVDKKELGWQDRKELEQIQQKQQQVRQMMQEMQRRIEENNRMEQRYREQSEQLMEKQRELDRLMNEVMDEKMKETMAEIDRMMQELDKKKMQQQLEQLKLDNAELERQLDQNIELMKRLEIEKRVEQTIQKMDRLAEEQRQLGERTSDKSAKQERPELEQRQRELNDRFQQLKQDIEQIKQDYKSLDPSTNFNVSQELEHRVEQQQQGAQQQLQKGRNKEASQMQREAADDMERLSEALAEAQLDAEQQDMAEDAGQVRQLLKNLVQLSFNQEELIDDIRSIYIQDPRYQTVIVRQNRIKDDFRNVEDSLRTLARRQVQVASAVTRELGEVNSNIARSLSGLLDMNQSFYGAGSGTAGGQATGYRNHQAATSMQYSMTSLNNLALILAESLDQMQNQMRQNAQKKKSGQCKNSGKSNNQCSNPGKGKPSPKSMRQMQEELNRQMEALKKQLEKQGNKPDGRHQIGQGQQMSEEFAKMAAQQEMIRRMMQQYGQEMKSASGGDPKLAREIDQMMRQMEQTETDLVNRTITRQTIQRQQQIMSRLLEHERAEMQREKEQRRESHEAGDLYSQPLPAELEKYNLQLHPSADPLHSLPPSLQPYYRQKVSDFFYR